MTEVQVVSKAQRAQEIYVEELNIESTETLRSRCMKRFEQELSLGKKGGSTYFQNCKTKQSGNKVKHYYKRKTVDNVTDQVDDSKQEQELFEVELKDETIKCFLSQQELDTFVQENPELIK